MFFQRSCSLETSQSIPDLSFRLLGVVAHQQFPEISNCQWFFAAKKASGGTWDCNNVIIGRHIPIQTGKSGGTAASAILACEQSVKGVSRQTAWYQLTLMACINAERRCQLWVECDLFDTLSSSWFAATPSSAKLALTNLTNPTKLDLTNPTNSNLSTCLLLLHKMREVDVKAVTFVTGQVYHTLTVLQLNLSFKIW